MKIRRYIGSNAQEAILKVKMDLGNDALILNTRNVRQKGILKYFTKPMVEVLAAVDEYSVPKKEYPTQEAAQKFTIRESGPVQQKSDGTTQSSIDDSKVTHLEKKITNLELMLKKIYQQVNIIGKDNDQAARNEVKEDRSKKIRNTYENLLKADVDADIAKQIADLLDKRTAVTDDMDKMTGAL
jgi:flagellar biosynthesis protein FlhF